MSDRHSTSSQSRTARWRKLLLVIAVLIGLLAFHSLSNHDQDGIVDALQSTPAATTVADAPQAGAEAVGLLNDLEHLRGLADELSPRKSGHVFLVLIVVGALLALSQASSRRPPMRSFRILSTGWPRAALCVNRT